MVPHRAADADAAGLGDPFEPRRDIDPVAEQVGAAHHDVAEIDADAVAQLPIVRLQQIARARGFLEIDGAAHRLDRAGELGQHAVAAGAEDAPVMPGDDVVDDLAEIAERADRPVLVVGGQARVADDVGDEDGGKLALDVRLFHGVVRDAGQLRR